MRESEKTKRYKFKAKVWKHKGPAGWHFVTLPKILSKTIRQSHGLSEEGWGRLKAQVSVGKSTWKTAIWYDSKLKSYLLPIKAVIRKREGIKAGASVKVMIDLPLDVNRLW